MLRLEMRRNSATSAIGFTLIELMVTLAILSLLIVVAVPSFSDLRRNSELSGVANNFISALNTARTEGMKRNMNSIVAPVNGDNDWSKGWLVFVDVDRSGIYSTGDLIVLQVEAPPSYISVSAGSGSGTAAESPSYLLFDGSGFSKTKTGGFGANTVQINRSDVSSTEYRQIRRVKVAKTGRVRVCTPQSATDSTCKSTGDEG